MNYPIDEKKLCILPHLRVNKRGFISIYALILLSVVLLFSSYMSQRIMTYTKLRSQDTSIHMLDIYIAHHIKKRLEQDQPPQIEEETSTIENEEPQEQQTSWEVTYKNFVLYFEQIEHEINVQYTLDGIVKRVRIRLDNEQKEIKDYAYVG